jgi:hypothetical protein
MTNATQTVFIRHGWAGSRTPVSPVSLPFVATEDGDAGGWFVARMVGVRRGRIRPIEGDPQVDVHLPSSDFDPFDEEADKPLALGKVELVQCGEDPTGEVLDAAA